MIAILEARRAGLLARAQWLPNIVAGVIVGIVALPLAMAFAIASGARPKQGLYTAILGGACVFSSSVAAGCRSPAPRALHRHPRGRHGEI
jgi:MFS superfamily sulfate permease-like transporter